MLQRLNIPRLLLAARRDYEYTIILHQPAQKRTLFFTRNCRCPKGKLNLWLPPIVFRAFFYKQDKGWECYKHLAALFVPEGNLTPNTRTFYIPLPNFSGAACCLGEFDTYSDTLEQGVKRLLDQFYLSLWGHIEPNEEYFEYARNWFESDKPIPAQNFRMAYTIDYLCPDSTDEFRLGSLIADENYVKSKLRPRAYP